MNKLVLSAPVSADTRAHANVFLSVFAAFGMAAPILLVIYAFVSSTDAIERTQLIVGGLESTVLVLVAALALRLVVGLRVKARSARLVTQ